MTVYVLIGDEGDVSTFGSIAAIVDATPSLSGNALYEAFSRQKFNEFKGISFRIKKTILKKRTRK